MTRPIEDFLRDGLVDADAARLAAEWPLVFMLEHGPGDTIVVAGAYEGKLMSLLMDLCPGAQLVGFEPQEWAYKKAIERLTKASQSLGSNFTNARGLLWSTTPIMCNFGLGRATLELPMGEFGTDAASFVNTGPTSREHGQGRLIEFGEAMAKVGIGKIDLFICNMEGYEFLLLPHMRKYGYLKDVDRLAIQWHPGLPHERSLDESSMDDEIAMLQHDGYHLTVDQRPAWTYLERRT